MKISAFLSGLAAVCVSVSAAYPALAAGHRNVLPEQSRNYDGGRSLEVLVAQAEIKSDINVSDVTAAAASQGVAGALIGALIDAKVNADRAKKAEREIQPVRVALTGFDVDALVKSSTDAALAKISWFHPAATSFSRDSSELGKNGALDGCTTGQLAFFEYTYDLSPDFVSVRVVLNIQLANRAVPADSKPTARLDNHNLAYAQKIVSVVSLASPSRQAMENADRWSANDGALARKALAMAFDDIAVLIPRALELTEADLKTMGDRSKQNLTFAGYTGRIQKQGDPDILLFNGGLVHIQTLPQ